MKIIAEIDEREIARNAMFGPDENDSCLKAFAHAFSQANSIQQAAFLKEIVKHLEVLCGSEHKADTQAIYIKDSLDERTKTWIGMMT